MLLNCRVVCVGKKLLVMSVTSKSRLVVLFICQKETNGNWPCWLCVGTKQTVADRVTFASVTGSQQLVTVFVSALVTSVVCLSLSKSLT